MKTYKDIESKVINGELVYHHAATRKGYVCVRNDQRVTEYSGKFGKGYIVERANQYCMTANGHPSNRYHCIEYFIEK